MKKDHIIQFVGFVTKQDLTEFKPQWEEYAAQIVKVSGTRLMQSSSGAANHLQFISQHEINEDSFRFNFMKGRRSSHFPEHQVRVVHAGGYIQDRATDLKELHKHPVRILAFIDHGIKNIDFFNEIAGLNSPGIYQAFYENCLYGHILEFLTNKSEAPQLVEELRLRTGIEAAIYSECRLSQFKPAHERSFS